MLASKGQASLIDLLMLCISISIFLVISFYKGGEVRNQSIASYESLYSQSALESLMNYKNESYGNFNNRNNLSISEAINLYLCFNASMKGDLSSAIGNFFNLSIKDNYIFYVSSSNRQIWTWNKQKNTCADYISMKKYNLKLSCQISNYNLPTIGIWPKWKAIPIKSNCNITSN